MPLVSVLIPAFKPDYLDLSIASALGQTLQDFELIISDDSADGDIESIISKWADPRIRYVRNPNRALPGRNRDHLISLASAKYLKFLHDDDFLFPDCLERLTSAAETVGAKLAFSWWYVIDGTGRPSDTYVLAEPDQVRSLSPGEFFDQSLARTVNLIGGPSHILLEAESLKTFSNPFGLDGIRMRFMTDIALFTNFADQNFKMIGLGFYGSVYRQHLASYSGSEGPAFSALLFEWELCQRWAFDHGHLTPSQFQAGFTLDDRNYRLYVQKYPELAPFIELGGRPGSDGQYLSAEFLSILDKAHAEIDARLSLRQKRDHGQPQSDAAQPREVEASREEVAKLGARLAQAQEEAEACRRGLDALHRTRTFRYTAALRRSYAALRQGGAHTSR